MSQGHAASTIGQGRDIDARSIVTLVVFLVVNAFVLFPLHIPLPLALPRLYRRVFFPSPSTQKTQPQPSDGKAERTEAVEGTTTPRWHLPIDLATAPVIGVLLLLASTCIPGSVVRDGIVGTGGVRPYDIMTLFISFAYISLSLDCTGLLRYLAFTVASRSAASGRLLYSTFFLFWVIAGLIVGNDPLILSGTPFLVYFTSHAAIAPPTAFLFTQFQAANLVSALLVSSNPTNLVLTQAFGVSFLSYSAWLAVPTIAAALVLYPTLRYFLFRGEVFIPKTLRPPKVDPRSALVDPWGGVFGASLFIITIVMLVGLSAGGKLEGVEGVWTVTAPAAIVMVVRDGAHDLWARKREDRVRREEEDRKRGVLMDRPEETRKVGPAEAVDGEKGSVEDRYDGEKADARASNGLANQEGPSSRRASAGDHDDNKDKDSDVVVAPTTDKSSERPPHSRSAENGQGASTSPHASPSPGDGTPTLLASRAPSPKPSKSPSPSDASLPTVPTPPNQSTPQPSSTPSTPPSGLFAPLRLISRTFPTPSLVFTRLPLPLVPFAFSMFILVEALQYTGWISVWAGWWAAWARAGGVAGSVWLMGTIGVLGCNLFGTNIGATVLLSRVLQEWQATTPDVSSRTLYGAVFALAVGSNFGAYSFVFPASLAGLLWRDILAQKGLHVSRREFVRWNAVPVVVTMVVGCLVVAGEVCVMYKS
ncbi:hypothetical protein JCM24511_04665 [Saitozyma sp. JCM 24511]|nr:hypothetical protein JCM24511_04665 [Saitozyma sp. JCM 24511]